VARLRHAEFEDVHVEMNARAFRFRARNPLTAAPSVQAEILPIGHFRKMSLEKKRPTAIAAGLASVKQRD
jgi:hypothetical protein